MAPKSPEPAPKTDTNTPLIGMPQELVTELLGLIRTKSESEASPTSERLLQALEGMAQGNKRLGEEFARTVRRANATSSGLTTFAYDKRCPHCKAVTPHPALDADGQVIPGQVGPLAHPKARLTHRVVLCGGPQTEDILTPLEIELFNSFTRSTTAHNGQWTAILKQDGNSSVLAVDFPAKTLDQLAELPRSLAELLGELLYGDEATDATDMVGEMMRLKKRIAELESVTVGTTAPAPLAAASA